MCDTFVVVEDGAVWFGKNSDREPGEAQAVQHILPTHARTAKLRATYIDVDQIPRTNEVVLSRPAWMWGAEMGANEHGLAIGNEAVFTKVPVARVGLLGMDLVRLALERCKTAEEALELITWMIDRYGQGGPAGHRDKRFAYHNAFVLADPENAFVLETAGACWAAERVSSGVRTTSNVLTIGANYTHVGKQTIDTARSMGLLKPGETFDFARAFADPLMGFLSGGHARRACTVNMLSRTQPMDMPTMLSALRDHAGHSVKQGTRITAPCAHASFIPTRAAGQTTGTQVSRLARNKTTGANESRHFMTGTSAPCISVLKPLPLGRGEIGTGAFPDAHRFDPWSLFWRAELLHRRVLPDYERRRATFEAERRALESRALVSTTAAEASQLFEEHADRADVWAHRLPNARGRGLPKPFDVFWRVQSRRDGMPV
jgi:dipeptidase